MPYASGTAMLTRMMPDESDSCQPLQDAEAPREVPGERRVVVITYDFEGRATSASMPRGDHFSPRLRRMLGRSESPALAWWMAKHGMASQMTVHGKKCAAETRPDELGSAGGIEGEECVEVLHLPMRGPHREHEGFATVAILSPGAKCSGQVPGPAARDAEASQVEGLIERLRTEYAAHQRVARDVVRAISHEVRTPISNIVGCAELLETFALQEGEEYLRLLEMVRRNAERLRRLGEEVESLLGTLGSSPLSDPAPSPTHTDLFR